MIFDFNHQLLSKHIREIIREQCKGAYKGQLAAGGVLVCCQLLIALNCLAWPCKTASSLEFKIATE